MLRLGHIKSVEENALIRWLSALYNGICLKTCYYDNYRDFQSLLMHPVTVESHVTSGSRLCLFGFPNVDYNLPHRNTRPVVFLKPNAGFRRFVLSDWSL